MRKVMQTAKLRDSVQILPSDFVTKSDGSVCQKTPLARQRPSLLLEEKVSPVRTLVTDVVENIANSPEV